MSVVKINALTIIDGEGDDFIARFSHRAGRIESADGFEGFQVLRPNDQRSVWLVVTRWRDDAAYAAWYASRTPRDPATVTYASGWEVWSFDLLNDVQPLNPRSNA